jgi:hypothetical protein
MDQTNIPRKTGDYKVEDFGDDIVLYNHKTTQVTYLNDSASLVWRLCDGSRTIEEIEALLEGAYPSVSSQIKNDLLATVIKLVNCGAIELI